MARLLMKNASHIVTCDPSDTVYTDSNLLMEDGVITYIGPEEQQAEEVIDAARVPSSIPASSTPITTCTRPSAAICLRYRIWSCSTG